MKKKLLYILYLFLLILIVAPLVFMGPYSMRVQHFEANPENGYHADFYLYVSPRAKRAAKQGKAVTLLIQPNNSGNSDDPKVHQKDAWWMGFGRHRLANDLGVALLVPAFLRPAEDWHIYTHALDRDVFTTERPDVGRIDLQLLAMVDKARSTLDAKGLASNEQFLIQGYSASGMFANRFAALHPKYVMAVAAGSPGGWPIVPIASYQGEALSYPAGIADIQALSGQPFDSTSYRAMPQLIVMGSLDDNDSLDFTDGWDEKEAELVKRLFGDTPISRWEGARVAYQLAGANVHFQLVEGVGHDRRSLQQYTTEFFRKILAER